MQVVRSCGSAALERLLNPALPKPLERGTPQLAPLVTDCPIRPSSAADPMRGRRSVRFVERTDGCEMTAFIRPTDGIPDLKPEYLNCEGEETCDEYDRVCCWP